MSQTFPIGDQAREQEHKGRRTRDDPVGKGEVGLVGVEMTGELVKGRRKANKENVVLEIV